MNRVKTQNHIAVWFICTLIHLVLLPFLLVLVLILVIAAIFVLYLLLLLVSVFFIREVLTVAKFYNTNMLKSSGALIKTIHRAQTLMNENHTHYTCCHVLISLVPYPSCGPYVCAPSCICLYACESLRRKTSHFVQKLKYQFENSSNKISSKIVGLPDIYNRTSPKVLDRKTKYSLHNLVSIWTACSEKLTM